MKKHLVAVFFTSFVLGMVMSAGPLTAFADTASAISSGASASVTPTKINARILPTIWYSTLSIRDGDSIKIHAAIQNNSGIDLSGVATFYMDGTMLAGVPFSSPADSLKDVLAGWVAQPGDHSVQVKVSTSLPADETLISSETDVSSISISRIITLQSVENAVLSVATSTLASTLAQANAFASTLADSIESFKGAPSGGRVGVSGMGGAGASGSISDASSASGATNASATSGASFSSKTSSKISLKNKPQVLGTSTGPSSGASGGQGSDYLGYFFNKCLDLLAFLVRSWEWTLAAIFVLFLLLKLAKRRDM